MKKRWLTGVCCFLLLYLPAAAWAQVDFSTQTPLTLFNEMAADTVTNALFNHYTPHPEMKFTVIPPVPGLDLTGQTNCLIALDFNNDGYLDVFQGNQAFPGEEPPKLLLNQRDGSFRPLVSTAIPATVFAGAAGDLDNDGWADLVLISIVGGNRRGRWEIVPPSPYTSRLLVLYNRGGTILSEPQVLYSKTTVNGGTIGHPVLMDFNQDSYLDLATVVLADDDTGVLMLWYGGAAGFGTATTISLGSYADRLLMKAQSPSLAKRPLLATVDYDHDGDQDILLQDSGYFPYQARFIKVLINDADGWREPVSVPAPSVSRQTPPIFADCNNDGRLEMFFGVSDFAGGRSALLVRNDKGDWVDQGREMGLWVGYNFISSAVWADWNNDGWLDLAQCLNFNEGAWTESVIDLNEAGAFFSNISDRVSSELGPGSLAAVALDVELDGDLDLILGHMTYYSQVMPLSATGLDLVRNDSQTGNWLAVRLAGTVSNRSAFGSRLELYAGAQHWLQTVPNGVHWGVSQPPATAHFGLAGRTTTDSLVVVWPNGVRENFGPQLVNHRVILREGASGSGTRKSPGRDRP